MAVLQLQGATGWRTVGTQTFSSRSSPCPRPRPRKIFLATWAVLAVSDSALLSRLLHRPEPLLDLTWVAGLSRRKQTVQAEAGEESLEQKDAVNEDSAEANNPSATESVAESGNDAKAHDEEGAHSTASVVDHTEPGVEGAHSTASVAGKEPGEGAHSTASVAGKELGTETEAAAGDESSHEAAETPTNTNVAAALTPEHGESTEGESAEGGQKDDHVDDHAEGEKLTDEVGNKETGKDTDKETVKKGAERLDREAEEKGGKEDVNQALLQVKEDNERAKKLIDCMYQKRGEALKTMLSAYGNVVASFGDDVVTAYKVNAPKRMLRAVEKRPTETGDFCAELLSNPDSQEVLDKILAEK
eukprot:CAMPEP_0178994106 /NCGR_PEP_ID=MMETSP0795-20121207/7091_1 /TAXON_ID=88552 /ORGANISM="Amoebophrya sp., Strain Ameob2" /LENGTH=358 /DNA_ID=CAMNT_0020686273 /DNA_START=23 /DNA_END=1099 /DNA_ORIENTATION=+